MPYSRVVPDIPPATIPLDRWRAWRRSVQPPLAPLAGARALAGFVVCFLLPVAVHHASRLVPGAAGHPLLLTSLTTTAVTLVYLVSVRMLEWRRVYELGLRPLPRELGIGLGLGVLACIGGAVAILLLARLGHAGEPPDADNVEAALQAFVFSRQAAVIEEIAFRGLLLRWLLGRCSPDVAVAIQALVFGVVHLPQGGLPHVLLATAMGLVFGYAFVWRRSLWTPMGVHFLWDLYALLPNAVATSEAAALAHYLWIVVVASVLAWFTRGWSVAPTQPAAAAAGS